MRSRGQATLARIRCPKQGSGRGGETRLPMHRGPARGSAIETCDPGFESRPAGRPWKMREMYSLIVGAVDGVLSASRLLEGAQGDLDPFVRPDGVLNAARLLAMPVLSMPETGDDSRPQVAQVGNVVSLTLSGRDYHFRFVRDEAIPPIPSERIVAAARALGNDRFDFMRTRWTVKPADLYQQLIAENIIGVPKPSAFSLPALGAEANRIAVMMRFSAEFASVWEALKATADIGGWVCQRADDIWDHSVVLNDVVALIARSKVVICDVTGRNANVFYEAGIAHTLGRELILITQSAADVPFDLRAHRYLSYVANSEGLADLRERLLSRLKTLMAR
jgi:hypothetical protein